MERGWQRHAALLDLSVSRIEALVRQAYPDAVVLGVEPLSGGLRNTNVRLDLAGAPSPLVFRAYTADPDACCREASVLVSLPPELPVPAVHFAKSDDDPPWALLDWCDGTAADRAATDAPASEVLSLAEQCGYALASIHGLRFAHSGFLGPGLRVVAPMPDWSEMLPRFATEASARLGPRLVAQMTGLAESAARDVDPLFGSPVLCHADFKLWNLLVVPSASGLRLSAILDWEFACAAPALLDAGIFLRDEARRPAGYAATFARGYAAGGGELPPDWRRLSLLLDLVNLCQLMVRGDERTAADLVPIVETTLDRV